MENNTSSVPIIFFAVATLALTLTGTAAAGEKVLFDFNGTDGNGAYSALIFDASGNLYGTTTGGGTYGGGTVFELTPKTKAGWTQKVLHSFDPNGIDGVAPYTRLIFDSKGNLYGTTNNGGPNNVGTVFELSPSEGGTWTESILYSFQNNEIDGTNPYGALIFDSSGSLYGTTAGGGYFYGTVYKLSPSKKGWTETILYNFNSYSGDATGPYSGLVFDGAGNLYGSTTSGGAYGNGTVFELTPESGGTWTETVLFSFDGQNSTGDGPGATPVFDAAGNLYGTTIYGGYYDSGMVYELTPPKEGGAWTETILHSFEPSDWDGGNPFGGLVLDSADNLYGTTNLGGRYNQGTVFEISPKKGGGWTEKLLHTFLNNGKDGRNPYCNLVSDTVGNLYGVAYAGGTENDGMVFEITN
jgi:uncharacterized repeat protein (TIGR03803 family)